MKFVIDSIITSEPDKCSTTIQNYRFVKLMLSKYDDVYFYWLLPKWIKGNELFFPKHPRIKYDYFNSHKDRTNQYVELTSDLTDMICFYGKYWDWDVLITNRAGLVPLMKLQALSPRQNDHTWTKEIWLVENMPFMKFKKTVANIDERVQDLYTLNGYLSADRVLIPSFHEKEAILKAASGVYNKVNISTLQNKIKNVIPARIENFSLKEKKFRYSGDGVFKVAYTGRLVASVSTIEDVWSSMSKNWVWKGDKNIELFVLTVSRVIKKPPPSFFKIKQLSREDFWATLKKDMHVVMNRDVEAGFASSLMEPVLQFGVPAILMKKPWSTSQLGDEYPFFANSEEDCYNMLRQFYLDYPKMYKLFEEYCNDYLWPFYEKAFKEDNMYENMEHYAHEFVRNNKEGWKALEGRDKNDAVTDMFCIGGDEFVIEDIIHKMGDMDLTKTLSTKTKRRLNGKIGLVWQTALNGYRAIMKQFYDYKDASIQVGHMKKVNKNEINFNKIIDK